MSALPSLFCVGATHVTVADPVAVPPEAAVTVIVKALSDALDFPSLTLITMPELAPTLAASGVPERAPVEALKLAQPGLF